MSVGAAMLGSDGEGNRMNNKLFVGGLAWATDDNGHVRLLKVWRGNRCKGNPGRDTGRAVGSA